MLESSLTLHSAKHQEGQSVRDSPNCPKCINENRDNFQFELDRTAKSKLTIEQNKTAPNRNVVKRCAPNSIEFSYDHARDRCTQKTALSFGVEFFDFSSVGARR